MFKEIASNPCFWAKVRQDADYKPLIDWLFESRKTNDISSGIPSVKFSDYRLYYDTGDRITYEEPYFIKRRMLNTYALLALIYPENDEYLVGLQDIIWAICDEYTWVLPAHFSNYPDTNYYTIDLFSAETGFALSEIKHLLADRLDTFIKNRIDDEIESRIIIPFTNNIQGWESGTNNWAAVCAASVAIAFMYQCPEQYVDIQKRIEDAMDNFLSGYPEDGTCLEGLAYWDYGFGFYVCYADMLKDFTGGKRDLFKLDKVKKIAVFSQMSYLTDDVSISFSDGSSKTKLNLGMLHQLKSIYPDDISVLPFAMYRNDTYISRWCQCVRNFIFYNPSYFGEKMSNKVQYYLKDAQWYIRKSPMYSFAVKGGNNDEPHNHNDIGSFILAKGDRQILTDLGSGIYTRQYFQPETRYDILCNSSLGHSVPLINGNGQCAGESYYGSLTVDGDTVTVEMKNAYNEPNLKKLERRLEFGEGTVKLTDSFEFDGEGRYVCRLVSYTPPEFYDNNIVVGILYIEYDDKTWEVSVSEEKHDCHDAGKSINVYLIDFKTSKAVNDITLNIKVIE